MDQTDDDTNTTGHEEREEETSESPTPQPGCMGCLKIFGGILLASLIVSIVGTLLWLWLGPSSPEEEMIDIWGYVIIGQEPNMWTDGLACGGDGRLAGIQKGEELSIISNDKAGLTKAELTWGGLDDDGNCEFRFNATVPVTDIYGFTIAELPQQDYRYALLYSKNYKGEYELNVRLAWG